MLRRPEGATIGQIAKALEWQLHSARGAISGSLKKKQGLTVVADKIAGGEQVKSRCPGRLPVSPPSSN
jgi:hypothetical protein